jgi:hypothetical protein
VAPQGGERCDYRNPLHTPKGNHRNQLQRRPQRNHRINPSELEAEAQRLIHEGNMPTFEDLSAIIAEIREKYRPLIIAARKLNEDVEN